LGGGKNLEFFEQRICTREVWKFLNTLGVPIRCNLLLKLSDALEPSVKEEWVNNFGIRSLL
jgi:hypothetical protein